MYGKASVKHIWMRSFDVDTFLNDEIRSEENTEKQKQLNQFKATPSFQSWVKQKAEMNMYIFWYEGWSWRTDNTHILKRFLKKKTFPVDSLLMISFSK